MRELRRRLRELPRERRKDVFAALRGGREVNDPRDAALAADYAEALDRKRQSWTWPRWILPRSRPTGWRAYVWLAHLVWATVAVVAADAAVWPSLPSLWRWVIVGVLAYSLLTTPFTIWRVLQLYWNAAAAARKNRELAARGG